MPILLNRTTNRFPALFLALMTAVSLQGAPAPGKSADALPARSGPGLDQTKVHFIYNEGEFDQVVKIIEDFTRANKTYSLEDSIFIAKHLAVIYTANIATRERGKRYMFQLLDLVPSAKIVDMFVSDEIDRVFQKVKEEYEERQKILGRTKPTELESNRYAVERMKVAEDSAARKQRTPGKEPRVSKEGSSGTAYWFAGGAVVAAAAAGTAFYLMQPRKGEDKVYVLP